MQVDQAGYLTDLLGNRAVDVINGYAKSDRPFFASLHFNAPHWPWEAPGDEAESERLRRKSLAGLRRRHAEDLPAHDPVHGRAGRPRPGGARRQRPDREHDRHLHQRQRRGAVCRHLAFHRPEDRAARRRAAHPIGDLVAGEDSKRRNHRPGVDEMDWMPTLLAAAGVAQDQAFAPDGIDLLPVLTQGTPPVPRKLFWRYKANAQRAARDGDYKFLKILDNTFLFNVVDDPMERANLKERQPGRSTTAWSRSGSSGTRTMLPEMDESVSGQFQRRGTGRSYRHARGHRQGGQSGAPDSVDHTAMIKAYARRENIDSPSIRSAHHPHRRAAAPRALAIAAHPDDIEFVMAGTLLRVAARRLGDSLPECRQRQLGSLTIPPAEARADAPREAQSGAQKSRGNLASHRSATTWNLLRDRTLRRVARGDPDSGARRDPDALAAGLHGGSHDRGAARSDSGLRPGDSRIPHDPVRARPMAGPVTIYHASPHGMRDGLRRHGDARRVRQHDAGARAEDRRARLPREPAQMARHHTGHGRLRQDDGRIQPRNGQAVRSVPPCGGLAASPAFWLLRRGRRSAADRARSRLTRISSRRTSAGSTKGPSITYGHRCGRDSIAFASSSFLNRSLSGSQNSLRFVFIAMWWSRQAEHARCATSTGAIGCWRDLMHSSQLPW